MLKRILIIAGVISVLVFSPSGVYALNDQKTLPAMSPSNNSVSAFGQNLFYSVYLRGNGEAVVSMRVQFTNYYQRLYSLRYFIPPYIKLSELKAYQVVNGYKDCYPDYQKYDISATPVPYDIKMPSIQPIPLPPCYSYPYGNTYQKADVISDGSSIRVNLPQPIYQNEQANFFITYRTFDYTRKDYFGVYSYTFESLKSDQEVSSLQAGFTTEQDYVLKDAVGKVNYINSSVGKMMPPAVDTNGSLRNSELDSFYQTIGTGMIIKYANNLAPMESYKVKGAYADSVVKLYSSYFVTALIIILILVIGVVIWVRKFKKGPKQVGSLQSEKFSLTKHVVLLSLLLSFASSVVIVGYTLLLLMLFYFIPPWGYYPWTMVGEIFIALISLSIYSLCLFIPAVLMFLKRGIWWAICTFGLTAVWLGLYFIILLLLFPIFQTPLEGFREIPV